MTITFAKETSCTPQKASGLAGGFRLNGVCYYLLVFNIVVDIIKEKAEFS